jgi:hypothetical protein
VNWSVFYRAVGDELAKIAAYTSHPGIISAPTPGRDGKQLKSTPAKPTTSKQLVGKVVSKTNLQKTNYTVPNTEVVQPDNSVAAGAHMTPPPPVRM